MRKYVFFLILLVLGARISAQELTPKEVLEKAVRTMPFEEGVSGKVTVKMVGIGETAEFATDLKMTYTASGEELGWMNDEVVYTVDTKEKTLTLETDDGESVLLLLPYMVARSAVETSATDSADKMEVKMKKTKSDYEFTLKKEGQSLDLSVDSKTFHIKTLKMKKGILTIMSMTYSDLRKLTDPSILRFDESKYSGYQKIDKRGKSEKK